MKTLLSVAILLNFLVVIVQSQAGVNFLFAISAGQKQEILNAHQAARDVLGATDMAVLRWSDGLAKIWPENNPSYCDFNHFAARNSFYTSSVGENLYAATFNDTFTNMITSWINEKNFYTYGAFPNFCQSGKVCGHYTQIIWAKTIEVGCAYQDCRGGRGPWPYLFVCEYSVAGNMLGANPYTKPTCVDTTTTCASVGCGSLVDTCGKTLNCPFTCSATQRCATNTCSACPSQCGSNTCGTVWNTCYNGGNGGNENCGANNGGCTGNNVCQNNQCVAPTPTCVPLTCATAGGCGVFDNTCGGTINCGCAVNEQCSLGTCQPIPPCGGACSADNLEICIDNSCECQDGFYRNIDTNLCEEIPPPAPTTSNLLSHWASELPNADAISNWAVLPDGSILEMIGAPASPAYRLRWESSDKVASEELTNFRSDVKLLADGSFSMSLRQQSSLAVYSNWIFTITGTTVKVTWAITSTTRYDRTKTTGGAYAGWKVNDWNTVEVIMEDKPNYDAYYGADYVWHSVKINGVYVSQYTYNGFSKSSFPEVGKTFIESNQYAAFTKTYLITSTSLLVTFSGCLTQADLDKLVASFNAKSASIESPCNAKRQGAGSSVVLVTFTSTETVSSKTLATQFTQAASSHDARFSEFPSVSKVESGQSAAGANEPVDPSTANIASSGGNSGLSTGAIVGIAVGSAVAAIIIAAVVAAAVIGAVVLVVLKVKGSGGSSPKATTSNDTDLKEITSQKDPRKPGPDLFDTEPGLHTSITFRAPAENV